MASECVSHQLLVVLQGPESNVIRRNLGEKPISFADAGGGTAIGSLVNGTIANPLNTTLGAGNTLKLDLNESGARDMLITTGMLNWGGNLAFKLTNTGLLANGSSWNFFNDPTLGNTGSYSGDLGGISLAADSIYGGLAFNRSGDLWTSATVGDQVFSFNETTGILNLGPTPVPEPASALTVLVLFSGAVLNRRKRAVRH